MGIERPSDVLEDFLGSPSPELDLCWDASHESCMEVGLGTAKLAESSMLASDEPYFPFGTSSNPKVCRVSRCPASEIGAEEEEYE